MPPWVKNAPQLRLGLQLYLVAYMDLSASRSIGMAEGRIPWGPIDDYAQANGYDPDQREDLHIIIRVMDDAYIKWRQEKDK